MTNSRLRIGVIGGGFGAAVHVPAFQSEGWDVPVLWGRRVERARETAERLAVGHGGTPEVVEDWRELVARDDLDAVAIATPPAAHLEMVTAALEAGKHVLCEKPFALNAAEAEQIRALAEARGRTAMVAHEFRFAPQRLQIKELLDEGYIGRPLLVSAELLMGRPAGDPPPLAWNARTDEGGGMLGALGSHFIDGFRHWFGDVATARGALRTARPDRRDTATGEVVQADSDDTFAFTLEFESGVVVSMAASSAVSPSQGGRITITGSDGVLVATQRGPNPEPDGVVLAGKSTDRTLEALPVPERFRPIEDDRDHRLGAFRLLVREFERGIREGVSPSPSFEDGLRCQQVLDAIRESAAS